ncbi:WG repeat-containing protein [Sulfuricurvum sp.]|uniref:WG repeat-containing protein n=1 Tax=Sulfuricurvum sp. TaxID=2025608 RepID=UPI002E379B93|nr:WG repeat-containing protein [Sulfuricurvum sp.]HEX5329555.1 WG repeat-containing protein [Sulfuricurvum sp.]
MGHYYFIQSVELDNRPTDKEELLLYKLSEEDTLVEWKYEVPPMFFPLFSSEPIYQDSILYCKGDEGLFHIKKMYDFLEKHREVAFDKPDEFLLYKQKIIDYLDESVQGYYQLNGTDVFAMSSEEEEFLEDSKTCYNLMKEVNDQIQEAIEKDDIEAFLSIYTDAGVTHKSAELRYFFNEPVYQYGFDCLVTYHGYQDSVQIFEENGKAGLKSQEGEVLLPPTYDEIFGFGENETYSVVRNGDKYGHIDNNGKLIIPIIYDDAYDFELDSIWDEKTQTSKDSYRAVVQSKGKYGVIDQKHTLILPLKYDDIHLRKRYGNLPFIIFVTLEGKKTILDIEGKELYSGVITAIHHPHDDEDDSGFINFYERLLVKTEDETYYLSPSFKPYGRNVEIIQNGLEVGSKRNSVHCFIARNKEGKFGVITWEDEIFLPFEYDAIKDMYNQKNDGAIFKVSKEAREALYLVANNQPLRLLIPSMYDKIGDLITQHGSKSYILVEKDAKEGLYDITENKEVLSVEFEALVYGGNNTVFTFSKETISQYLLPSLQECIPDFEVLESALKWSESSKKAKIIFKKLKSDYMKKTLDLMFSDPADHKTIKERYRDVNFLQPKSILDAAGKLEMRLTQTGAPIDDMRIFYDAYAYHFEQKKGALEELNWALMHYLMAKMYYEKGEYSQALQYAKGAKTFIHPNNMLYTEVLQFICYTYYDFDKNEDAVAAGLEGLESVMAHRSRLTSGKMWVGNVKKERDTLNDFEETFNYYVGCAYFYQEMRDYQKALEYIEKSITNKNDWNVYTKNYIRAVSAYQMAENPMDVLPLLQEVDELGKHYNVNDDHSYIKYLLAYSYYHNFNDPQNALEKLEESLAINPDYTASLKLKMQIEEKNEKGKSKGFFSFFRK